MKAIIELVKQLIAGLEPPRDPRRPRYRVLMDSRKVTRIER